MGKKISKSIISVCLIFVLSIISSFTTFGVTEKSTSETNLPEFIVSSNKVVAGKTFNVEISLKNNPGITALQLNVNYDMTIHGTIFKNNFFRNDKIVTLNTTARYKIDLDDVMSNVIFSGDNITVLVHINTEVLVNEDSIIYRDDKGYLAFGDVTITPEEYNSMVVQAKENISSEMMKKENYDVAKENVEKRVKEIITTVGHDTYNINIKWI